MRHRGICHIDEAIVNAAAISLFASVQNDCCRRSARAHSPAGGRGHGSRDLVLVVTGVAANHLVSSLSA